MMHLQLRHELDLETNLEPSVIAASDGSIHALNRVASRVLDCSGMAPSLFDICRSRADSLRAFLVACSGSRLPLIEQVRFDGPGGAADYRCVGHALVPRRRSRPATLLLRLHPARDARFSAAAERMKRLAAERQRRLAMQQCEELRSDRLRLVEQYCYVAEALRIVEARTHELRDKVNHIRADERERIARDLHDHVGHEMALALAELRTMQHDAEGPAKARLGAIVAHIGGIGRKIHHAVTSGRPHLVEELGFVRAIEAMAASFAADGRIDLCFRTKGLEPELLPAAVECALYRVAQEALTNIVKHALGARKIDITLDFARESLALTMADDGAGIRLEAVGAERHGDAGIGLRGMRRRMEEIGGTLEVGPRLDKGTIVTAVAPLVCAPQRSLPS
ncbi:ATP-binding protein [Bosea sp. CS1GBMeth4]|uniref:sensor histidine kinase n=1 Tax=Bosea sp. CS1GBMeth4 TaxID=1892849 RepID=UPI0016476C5D|nr:ATP-binding protein [Bosea sp. CS1GBMeth4]